MLFLAKEGDGFKLIRFGMQGAKTKPPRKGESMKQIKQNARVLRQDTLKILPKVKCAAYWANVTKWS